MEAMSLFFKRAVPTFFESLPIPDSISGFSQLTGGECLELIILAGGIGAITYATYDYVMVKIEKSKGPCGGDLQKCPVNVEKFKPDVEKIVDFVDIEDVAEKVVLCRCWRSKKFPLCDGSHAKHNKETKDNIGPVIIRHKPQ